MKASARIAIQWIGDRNAIVDRRSCAPLSIRPCGDRILLASSAAAPVGGDELELAVDVGDDARADVGSVAAGMIWPGVTNAASSMVTKCTIGARSHLDLRFEPTISVAGSRHAASTVVDLDPAGTCRIVEEVVLGRRNEPSGRLDVSMRVSRAGRPLVHHDEAFGPDVAGALSSVSVGPARFALTAVLVGVDAGSSQVSVDDQRAACWLPVAPDAVVVLAVGPDRPAVVDLVSTVAPALGAAAPA